ncbi:hypothetical protein CN637_07025 [Bacillus toyonensis]|nr:hypothetical protein CN637_07025 [Bacillus toyonensis]PHE44123.1 hypothetical protein COF71_24860 [Bacillus toyonensis]
MYMNLVIEEMLLNIKYILYKGGSTLIAEIYGKISSDGSNLSERLEDKLTGDIFGSLRYLPYRKELYQLVSGIKFLNYSYK